MKNVDKNSNKEVNEKRAKNILLGAVELCLFMKEGVDRFSDDKNQAIKSFLIPLMIFPLSVWFMRTHIPLGTEDIPFSQLLMAHIAIVFVFTTLTVLFLYAFASVMDRKQHYWRLLTASNCVGLIGAAISLPFIVMSEFQIMEYKTIEDVFIVIQIYSYVVSAYVLCQVLKVNWQLAASMTIALLFINESTHDIIFKLCDIPLVDYFDKF